MMLCFSWASFLFSISLGGLALWLPVAITTFYAVHNLKKTGPASDTWKYIAETKLFYGFSAGLCVYATTIAFTLPNFPATLVVVPVIMWISLRWFEDAASTARAFLALGRLLCVNPETLSRLRAKRSDLHHRVVRLAVDELGLPTDPERHFVVCGEANGRVVGRWAKKINHFSVWRRRKRSWNETLRLYEQFDYPPEDS
jgi:glycerol-3-phosphate O-acyltransferase/dihydroxyacetone phosphate acyltransferase